MRNRICLKKEGMREKKIEQNNAREYSTLDENRIEKTKQGERSHPSTLQR